MKELVCSICGKTIKKPKGFFNSRVEYPLCEHCLSEVIKGNYEACTNCGRPIPKGYHMCRGCVKNLDKTLERNYSFKPVPLFFNDDGTNVKRRGSTYFGVELEFSYANKRGILRYLKDFMEDDKVYAKPDASLTGGIEIVTSPMEINTSLATIGRVINGAIANKERGTYDLGYGAGFHVHVNREAVPVVDLYKLNLLLNFKDTEIGKMYYLAGRREDTNTDDVDYCHSSSKDTIKSLARKGSNRYVILNEQNRNTLEFRIFKATHDFEQAMGYMETVQLLLSFAHEYPLRLITINNFLLYVTKRCKNEWLRNRAKKALGGSTSVTSNDKIVSRIAELINTYGEENMVRVINAIEKHNDATLYKLEKDIIHKEYKCKEGNLFIDYMLRRLEEAECV